MRDNSNISVWLSDILESIDLIENYIRDINEDEFFNSEEKQDAVARRLEIIGEAVKNIPETFKNQNPGPRWREAAGMRNILIHEYFDVDHDLVWSVLQSSLPEFKNAILALTK